MRPQMSWELVNRLKVLENTLMNAVINITTLLEVGEFGSAESHKLCSLLVDCDEAWNKVSELLDEKGDEKV